MLRQPIFKSVGIVVAALGVGWGAIAIADPAKEQPAGAPAMQLPPGWTSEDAQACATAAMPGKMHEHLASSVGVWHGENTIWMFPGAEPVKSESISKITSMMDGRYIQCEMSGEMLGMGPYSGLALYGFDNVSGKFVSTWLDNMGTGMAHGTGELSGDGKTLTWLYTFNCPITKKPATLREVETVTGVDAKKLEMWAADPKTGKEFKMMEIELTRKPASAEGR